MSGAETLSCRESTIVPLKEIADTCRETYSERLKLKKKETDVIFFFEMQSYKNLQQTSCVQQRSKSTMYLLTMETEHVLGRQVSKSDNVKISPY